MKKRIALAALAAGGLALAGTAGASHTSTYPALGNGSECQWMLNPTPQGNSGMHVCNDGRMAQYIHGAQVRFWGAGSARWDCHTMGNDSCSADELS